jgi:hypothetical protein
VTPPFILFVSCECSCSPPRRQLTVLGFRAFIRWRGGCGRRDRRRREAVVVGRRAEPQERPVPVGAGVHADHLRAHTPVRRFLGTRVFRLGRRNQRPALVVWAGLCWPRTDHGRLLVSWWQMGVFCFPAGATLPLHDHPEMVVLSKLLYGSVRVRSYDWVAAPPRSAARKCGLARVVAADEVRRAPCEASVLFPQSGGNLHAFTAVTPCAILDVLTPPYSEESPSTYFSDVPIPSLPGTLLPWKASNQSTRHWKLYT